MKFHLLHVHATSALLLLNTTSIYAACVDNGDGTSTCDANSAIIDANVTNRLLVDNTLSPSVLEVRTQDIDNFGQTTINQMATGVGTYSILSPLGNNPMTINNNGAVMFIQNDASRDFSAGLSNDADGRLLSGGLPVGMASVISAGSNVSALTINNSAIPDGIVHTNIGWIGIPANISNFGQFTASVYTNTPLLNINNKGNIGEVYSYGTGLSLISAELADYFNAGGYGSVYVVDRNPLLTKAQELDPSLVLAYGTDDVGVRDSIINMRPGGNILNLVLGSGTHVVNVENSDSGYAITNIMVDQRDADMVSVVGGVATTTASIHGGRSFTLNSNHHAGLGNIVLNDVVGAVNTLNIGGITDGQLFGSITANGLGLNTLNISCKGFDLSAGVETLLLPCDYLYTTVSGMTNINFLGNTTLLGQSWSATDTINIDSKALLIRDGLTLTAPNVIVSANAVLGPTGERFRMFNQVIGDISGNLLNRGEVFLGDAVLDVSGDTAMADGSKLTVSIGDQRAGQLNTAGLTTFAPTSSVQVEVKSSVLVRDGDTHVIARNVVSNPSNILQLEEGKPILTDQSTGFLQWSSQLVGGDLMITANSGPSPVLKSLVTPAAANAADAFFAYKGNDFFSVELLKEIQTFTGLNAVRVAERLRPEIHDGAIRMVLGNTDRLFNILDNRLMSSYLPSDNTLLADESASSSFGNGLWVQGYGHRGSQQGMQGADGYGMSAVGMAAGMDKPINEDGNSRAGLAFAYTRGNIVNEGNTVNNRLDTSSYMGALYASYIAENYYVNGMLGIGRHVYETDRNLLRFTAVGTHDSRQYAAHLGIGFPYGFEETFYITPYASVDYSKVKESGYQERGTESTPKLQDLGGGSFAPIYEFGQLVYEDKLTPINLNYSSRNIESIRGGIGARAIYKLEEPTWSAELAMHGIFRHEFADIAQDSTANFVIGSSTFKSQGINPARNDFNFGGSVLVSTDDDNDQITFMTSYDANIREKYFGQNVSLNLRYDFDQAPRYLKQAAHQKVIQATRSPEKAVHATDKDVTEMSNAMKPVAKYGRVETPEYEAIKTTLNNWLIAQTNKTPDIYLNSYAADFQPNEGGSRQQWERKRRYEISKSQNSGVTISYLNITPQGNQAIAIFNQAIQEDEYVKTFRKVMDLENRNGRWLIVREDSLPLTQ